jgi:beta-glucosidase
LKNDYLLNIIVLIGDVTFESGDSYFGKNLTDAVDRGDVEAARVKDMAKRIVAAWYKVGQDKDFPETTINAFHREKAPYNNVQRNHKKIVYEGAVGSSVLLSNNGVLPLSNKVKKIAVIGSDAGQDPK